MEGADAGEGSSAVGGDGDGERSAETRKGLMERLRRRVAGRAKEEDEGRQGCKRVDPELTKVPSVHRPRPAKGEFVKI